MIENTQFITERWDNFPFLRDSLCMSITRAVGSVSNLSSQRNQIKFDRPGINLSQSMLFFYFGKNYFLDVNIF